MQDPRLNGNGHFAVPAQRATMLDGALTGGMYEDDLALFNPFQVIRRRLWIIVLVAAVVVAAVGGFSLQQRPEYQGSIKILIGQEQVKGVSDNIDSEVQGLQQLTTTMAEAVRTRPVAEDVIGRLGLSISTDSFLDSMSVEQVAETQFIEVSYEDFSPERAQLVANVIGEEFEKRVAEESPSASAITVDVWESAALPVDPVSPNPVRNMLLAIVLGLMLGVGLAFLLDYRLSDGMGSPIEAEKVSGVPTYGTIPTFKVRKRNGKKERKLR